MVHFERWGSFGGRPHEGAVQQEKLFTFLLCFCLGVFVNTLMHGPTMCFRGRLSFSLASRRFLQLVPALSEFRNHRFLHHRRVQHKRIVLSNMTPTCFSFSTRMLRSSSSSSLTLRESCASLSLFVLTGTTGGGAGTRLRLRLARSNVDWPVRCAACMEAPIALCACNLDDECRNLPPIKVCNYLPSSNRNVISKLLILFLSQL